MRTKKSQPNLSRAAFRCSSLLALLAWVTMPAPGTRVEAAAQGSAPAAAQAPATEMMVYAAASLRDALGAIKPLCDAASGVRMTFNFGASNDLARQVEAGNKADIFFSADESSMDRLERSEMVDNITRRTVLSNRLVVVGPADSTLRIASAADLGGSAVKRLALANPEGVPAGRYAKAWLEKAGVWPVVEGKVVPTVDVRAALAAVESGGVEAGIVYRTDASISKKVKVLYEVPESEGPAIAYALAALKERPHHDAARRLAACLAGPEAAAVFQQFGFVVPKPVP